VSSNEKEPYQRYGVRSAQNKSKSGDFETSSASPLDAADRALGATLKIGSGFRDGNGLVGKEKALRASSFYETDEDDSPGSDSFLRRTPSASRTRASLERAAAAASSFETLRVAPSPTRQGRSPSSAAAKGERPGDARVVISSLVAGAATVAGGVNGVAKENQDSFFFVDGGVAAPGDFAAGVLDGHGADGARVSKFVCSKIKAALSRYFSFVTNVDGTNENETRSRTLYGGVGSAALASRRREARLDEREKLEDVLAAAFAEADKALRSAPRGSFDHEESGCTCVVVVRKGDFLITANVGDSRAVLASEAKKESALKSFSTTKSVSFGANRRSMNETPSLVLATDLSSDHKPDRSDEKARIERTGFGCVERARDGFFGFAGPYRVWRSDTSPRSGGLAVSRAFGDTKLARAGVTSTPEISAHDLRSALEERRRFGVDGGDVKDAPLCVILASDGVWDHVSSEAAAIAAAVPFATSARHSQSTKAGADALKVQAAADAIAAKAVAGWRGAANGGYRDDITVVVVPLAR
jgi:serine/threonine protein phosphatase PrpC